MRAVLVVAAYALALFAVLYFFVLLPGKKKNQEQRAMHDSVKPGDRVVTIGGMVATVLERDGDTVRLLIDEATGTAATFVIYAVRQILPPGEQTPKS